MFVPPEIHILNPKAQCDGIRRCGLWEVIRLEGQSPHNGISALLIKEAPER